MVVLRPSQRVVYTICKDYVGLLQVQPSAKSHWLPGWAWQYNDILVAESPFLAILGAYGRGHLG
jgi:hypothetical protein